MVKTQTETSFEELFERLTGLDKSRGFSGLCYRDVVALIALTENYHWGNSVRPKEISDVINAFSPRARMTPESLAPYFQKLQEEGFIEGSEESGYTVKKHSFEAALRYSINLAFNTNLIYEILLYYHFD